MSVEFNLEEILGKKDLSCMGLKMVENILPYSIEIGNDYCRVTNDNGFGLVMIVDRHNKKMIQIDGYSLDYYLN